METLENIKELLHLDIQDHLNQSNHCFSYTCYKTYSFSFTNQFKNLHFLDLNLLFFSI